MKKSPPASNDKHLSLMGHFFQFKQMLKVVTLLGAWLVCWLFVAPFLEFINPILIIFYPLNQYQTDLILTIWHLVLK